MVTDRARELVWRRMQPRSDADVADARRAWQAVGARTPARMWHVELRASGGCRSSVASLGSGVSRRPRFHDACAGTQERVVERGKSLGLSSMSSAAGWASVGSRVLARLLAQRPSRQLPGAGGSSGLAPSRIPEGAAHHGVGVCTNYDETPQQPLIRDSPRPGGRPDQRSRIARPPPSRCTAGTYSPCLVQRPQEASIRRCRLSLQPVVGGAMIRRSRLT